MPFQSRIFACKRAIAERIAGLTLLNAAGGAVNIIILKLPTDDLPDETEFPDDNIIAGNTTDFPMIQVTHSVIPDSWSTDPGTNHRANVIHPIQITTLAEDNRDLLVNDDLYSSWREKMIEAFTGELCLQNVPEIWKITVIPTVPLDTIAFFRKDIMSSSFVIQCHERRQTNHVTPDTIPLTL